MSAEGSVQSVIRAFDLLECMAESDAPLGVTELAASTGLPPATIHRLLRTLVDSGYARQSADRTYQLGRGLIRLGERAMSDLALWARPILEDVVRAIGESVNLAAMEGDQVLYVAHVPGNLSMRMFTEVGSRVPAHSTGVGKAMLAALPREESQKILARTELVPLTGRTITDRVLFAEELRAIAVKGYAVDDGEQELGVRCVAVALPTHERPFAISISGPSSRMTPELVDRAVPVLHEAARIIAYKMEDNDP